MRKQGDKEKGTYMLKVNYKKIKAYGDRLDDGAMQLSFTLPVYASEEAKEAAKRYVEALGLEKVAIASMEAMGDGFTFFVAYGNAKHTIDITKIKVPKVQGLQLKFEPLKDYMEANIDRPLVVVGAAIGSDAHTVGIDAIMNMKGYDHDYGLERYPMFHAYNLRSQITAEALLAKAAELKADAILISQVVTQRDSHIKNLKEFREMATEKGLSKDVILIVGGPRLDHAMALKLGFDAGFGTGTKPSQVAGFIISEYMKRKGIKEKTVDAKKSDKIVKSVSSVDHVAHEVDQKPHHAAPEGEKKDVPEKKKKFRNRRPRRRRGHGKDAAKTVTKQES